MTVLLLACLAAAGFAVATLLVESALGTSRAFHQFSVVIAAGILLGIALGDLLPEAFELLEPTRAGVSIAAGFLLLYMVETLTGGHTHHHEPHAPGHCHGAAHAHTRAHAHDQDGAAAEVDEHGQPCVPTHAVLPFLVGLGLHNVADGVVIGASHEVSDSTAAGVAAGILVHQLPVGLSFAAVLLASGYTRRRTHRATALVAALIPVGALAVLLLPDPSTATLGTLIGVAAGALLYIATGHLLPEAHNEQRRPAVAAAFSTALLVTVLFIGTLHGDAHEHGDDGHDEDAAGHVDEEPHG